MKLMWLAAGVLALSPAMALSQDASTKDLRFGVQGSWGDDADLGIGARLDVDLDDMKPGLGAYASFDYFFPEEGDDLGDLGLDADANYWEINANATYTLSGSLAPYVGAGLNVAHGSFGLSVANVDLADESETDLGLNLLGGVRLTNRIFAEARLELGGGEQFVVTAGVLF